MDISKIDYPEIAGKFNLLDCSFDTYDVNKDGKISEEDFAAASDTGIKNTIRQLLDAADEDPVLQKSGAEKAGATDNGGVTKENAETIAAEIIDSVKKGLNDPQKAETLNQLQQMGTNLTKQIEQSAVIAKLLEAKIQEQDAELEKIAKEKEVKEREYRNKEGQVAAKSEELSAAVISTLNAAEALSAASQQAADNIIKKCVEDYAKGEYPNRSLQEVIQSNLFQGSFNISRLQSQLSRNEALGAQINSICGDIDVLVADIKDITEKYNAKNEARNTTNDLLKGITEAATNANKQYQTGYAKREAMRKEIINKYKVKGVTAGDPATDNNPQVQKLGEFLDNGELDKMPFKDAWAILTQTFDECGIAYNVNTGAIAIPYGHNAGAREIYNALVDALTRNYKSLISRTDEEFDDPDEQAEGVTTVTRTDPISFTNGDIKYDFVVDKNNNGVLDNSSEFLGAAKGWEEMKAYDKDGDGVISGNELKNIKLAAINQTNGQFNFVSAEEAGIESIDLNSFKELNQKEVNKDITVGTFELQMKDGQVIEGKQTNDTNKNIANTYSTMFGNKIEDRTTAYDDNPFMDEFVETTDTELVATTSDQSVKRTTNESDAILKLGKAAVDRKTDNGVYEGERRKAAADEKAKAEKKAEEKKETAKKEETKAEENKKAEKKAAAKKAAAQKSENKNKKV